MAYSVELTPRATADIDAVVAYIGQFAPEAAGRWLDGLMQAVFSLEELPARCPRAPEAEKLGVDLRRLLYGRRSGAYRIVFRIYEDRQPPVVRIVGVRHGARDRLKLEDIIADE